MTLSGEAMYKRCSEIFLGQGCQTHFHQGPHQPPGCLQGAECNFNSLKLRSSYIYKVLQLHSAL